MRRLAVLALVALAALGALVAAAGCGAKTGLGLDPGCATDDDCASADFCGDVPVCRFHACVPGGPRDCRDTNECTVDACDGAASTCTHVPRDRDADGHGDDACGGDDCDDLDPTSHPGARELCTGGRDEDCDGHFDCSDPDCASDPACIGCMPESCTNGHDDDCDALVDCADMDCRDDPACCTTRETSCTDRRDEDCDGAVDCADPDCVDDPACCVPSSETCDGTDEDCDGVVDDGATCFTVDDVPIDPITASVCARDWYSYDDPATASANPVPDIRTSGAVVLAVHLGPASCGGWSVALIADMVDDGSGGTLRGTFAVAPIAPTGYGLEVSDESSECRYDAGLGIVTCDWTWQPCCTDGAVVGPIPLVGDFCVVATLTAASGVSSLLVQDGATSTIPHAMFTPARICARTLPAVP